jgi:Putative transposase
VWSLRVLFRTRGALVIENLALRQQPAAYTRRRKRVHVEPQQRIASVPCDSRFVPRVDEPAGQTYEDDLLAACLRDSLGIRQVVALDEAGDVQESQEQADERRFAVRKSPHTGEFGGFTVHAGVTVHAADKEDSERLIRYCARPALSMEMCAPAGAESKARFAC